MGQKRKERVRRRVRKRVRKSEASLGRAAHRHASQD
jgi:hypothetical protein